MIFSLCLIVLFYIAPIWAYEYCSGIYLGEDTQGGSGGGFQVYTDQGRIKDFYWNGGSFLTFIPGIQHMKHVAQLVGGRISTTLGRSFGLDKIDDAIIENLYPGDRILVVYSPNGKDAGGCRAIERESLQITEWNLKCALWGLKKVKPSSEKFLYYQNCARVYYGLSSFSEWEENLLNTIYWLKKIVPCPDAKISIGIDPDVLKADTCKQISLAYKEFYQATKNSYYLKLSHKWGMSK